MKSDPAPPRETPMTDPSARLPLERLIELATREARRAHEHALYAASNGHPDKGHVDNGGDWRGFSTCPHSDCVAVRAACLGAPQEQGECWTQEEIDDIKRKAEERMKRFGITAPPAAVLPPSQEKEP